METYIMPNGNIIKIKSKRFSSDKCIFTGYMISYCGYWIEDISDSFTIGYYNGMSDFINSNY